MHAVKGSWVGQTFALAKCNDSGGKKSRIRRSKEERKALVESFIKKYQKSNNGSFPSLKLTREEVGGSFYTIREIVREVIQENRVLGPATFTPELQNHDDILEQYPIGSISIEPETKLSSANGSLPVTHILPHHHDTREELIPSASMQGLEPENHSLGDMLFVSGSTEIFLNNEHERKMGLVSEDREIFVLDESVEVIEVSSAKVTYLEADSTLAISPLTSGSGITYDLDEKLSVVNGGAGEKGGESFVVEKSYVLTDEKLVGEIEIPLEENLNNCTAKEGAIILPSPHQDGSEELTLNANAQDLEPEQQSFGEVLQINGTGKAFEIDEERQRKIAQLEGNVENLIACEDKASLAQDMVEVFPVLPVSEKTYCLNEKSSDGSVENENLGEKENSSVVDETNFQECASDLTNARTIANLAVQQLENCCDFAIEKPKGKVEVPSQGTSEVSTVKEGTALDSGEIMDTEVKDASVFAFKITDPVNGRNVQSSKDSKIGSPEQKIPKIAIKTASDPKIQVVDNIKETNPTLDRMNLESWKTSDKHQKPTNPLLVVFKAFVTAFVKFWSE